jgi:phosphoglycolate phosphatase-like HAD superfamily hydrolase
MSGDRAILLDVDGTLVDSNYLHVDAWAQTFARAGHTVPAWRIHRAIGMGGDKLLAELIGEQAAADAGEVLAGDHDRLFEERIGEVRSLPGATALLRLLHESRFTVVLASSARTAEVEHYLDLLEARSVVDAWTTSDDVDRTKPDPELLQVAIERAGVPALAMVGDAVWDCRAAGRAGLPCLALRSGGISACELEAAGAARVLDDAQELGRVIREEQAFLGGLTPGAAGGELPSPTTPRSAGIAQ